MRKLRTLTDTHVVEERPLGLIVDGIEFPAHYVLNLYKSL